MKNDGRKTTLVRGNKILHLYLIHARSDEEKKTERIRKEESAKHELLTLSSPEEEELRDQIETIEKRSAGWVVRKSLSGGAVKRSPTEGPWAPEVNLRRKGKELGL